ncbi:twin-arginine translocation signal domain-containing protein [Leisingera sp.]|uniref:twin-arginine translocation signal domain-containing protein n=1 Tax=Leisingera sp. TaxID=1879318 RepID=UPI002B27AB67|nr:hypothetical protein [Leisingera sp.]
MVDRTDTKQDRQTASRRSFLKAGLMGGAAVAAGTGVAGAAGGAVISSATGGSPVTGAVVGGAAGYFCRDLNVPGCRNN